MIKYIDLFAGVGGFHYGLEAVNRQEEAREHDNALGDILLIKGANGQTR
jgi:hypothetical protein